MIKNGHQLALEFWKRTKARIDRGEIKPTETQLVMVNGAIERLTAKQGSSTIPASEARCWPDPGPLPWPSGVARASEAPAVSRGNPPEIEPDDVPW